MQLDHIDLDVLIVGGGAQGLWLLNDLNQRGYRVILLENDKLGGGQTCHSHALIHRGHYYDDPEMMIVLNASAEFWRGLLRRAGLEPLNRDGALAGFGPGIGVDRYKYMWNLAGLRYAPLEKKPQILDGSRARYIFATDEFSIDASQAMEALGDR